MNCMFGSHIREYNIFMIIDCVEWFRFRLLLTENSSAEKKNTKSNEMWVKIMLHCFLPYV